MKTLALALLILFGLACLTTVSAQQSVFVTGIGGYQPYASETVTVTNGAVSTLTASKYAQQSDESNPMRHQATIFVTGNQINYWLDGSTPTTSAGLPGYVGQWIKLNNPDELAKFKCISTGTNAVLYVHYGRQ